MKKILLSLLLAACTAGSILAGTPTGPIVLRPTNCAIIGTIFVNLKEVTQTIH